MIPPARQELSLHSPWLNAAGTLGFVPPRRWRWPAEIGAFVTNPLSRLPRTPAAGRCAAAYPGGFLLHTGAPNPGLRAALRQYARTWQRTKIPVWVHLLAEEAAALTQMVAVLEDFQDVVQAVEIGLPPGVCPAEAQILVQAALGELPVVAAVPLTEASEARLSALIQAGASAVSFAAPRGCLPGRDGSLTSGRLYGPALLPLALAAVCSARAAGLPVIAAGGVYSLEDGQKLLAAGALAVQLDAVLWAPPCGQFPSRQLPPRLEP
ncbi:MAG: hypothetical protein IT308_00315 [Anaerolineaceae bacterium]|nr:hypothetical protein [Anaerolineaceae bacterium]